MKTLEKFISILESKKEEISKINIDATDEIVEFANDLLKLNGYDVSELSENDFILFNDYLFSIK